MANYVNQDALDRTIAHGMNDGYDYSIMIVEPLSGIGRSWEIRLTGMNERLARVYFSEFVNEAETVGDLSLLLNQLRCYVDGPVLPGSIVLRRRRT